MALSNCRKTSRSEALFCAWRKDKPKRTQSVTAQAKSRAYPLDEIRKILHYGKGKCVIGAAGRNAVERGGTASILSDRRRVAMERQYAYEAFISYRHNPRDFAIAAAISKLCEGFTIPSEALRQQLGRKKVGRLFRTPTCKGRPWCVFWAGPSPKTSSATRIRSERCCVSAECRFAYWGC